MKKSQINFVVEKEIKEAAEKVFYGLGITLSQGIKLYLMQVTKEQGIPFPLNIGKNPNEN